jgi:hypothetical protein
MASRAALRWWPWAVGKPPAARVARKWLSAEAPEVFPLMLAVGAGVSMGLGTIAWTLLYNPSVMCGAHRASRGNSRCENGFCFACAARRGAARRACWRLRARARQGRAGVLRPQTGSKRRAAACCGADSSSHRGLRAALHARVPLFFP